MRELLSKYKMMKIQAKAAIWFVACSFFQKGISFITVPIFTRLMTTEQYGTYSVYLSWLQILTIFCTFNLFYGTLDNGLSKYEEDRDTYISSMQGLCVALTCVWFIVYLVAPNFWERLFGLSPVLMLLMFSEILITPALSFWSGRQRFEYKYKRLVFFTLVRSLLNPLVGIVLVSISADKAVARIAAIVIVELLISGSIMAIQFYKGKSFFHRRYWKYGLTLAVPMLPHYLAGTILNQGDRIMIEKMVGKSEVAFYSVAYSVGMIANIFTNAINSSITPMFYGKFKSKDVDDVPQIINGLLIIVFSISLGMMVISPELVLIFGSGKYLMGQYVIPPVAASVFFIFLYGIFSLPQFYFEKTKFLMLSSIFAALINVILNYVFIMIHGFIAAGYTTLVCYVLYSIGHYIVSKRIIKKEFGDKKLFDVKTIATLGITLIAFSIGINFLFAYRVVRVVIVLLVLLAAYINRNRLNKYMGMLKNK